MKLLALLIVYSQVVNADASFRVSSNDFKSLFNQYRVAQPKVTPWAGSFFPYSAHGTAAIEDGGHSPMHAYDKLIGSDPKKGAYEWEKENHTCKHLRGEEKESCEGWWGHCNGWAAAAIKEVEPTKSVRVNNINLTVADQKGIYSELWMSTDSLFAGDTEKSKKTGAWVKDQNAPEYQAFWDVSPKSFFLLFTNYIGIQKTGLALDRFTGDEVWNQPVVGYRILPLRKSDIQKIERDGQELYSVALRMKFYWANDMGTPANHVTAEFDIHRHTNDQESLEKLPHKTSGVEDFEGRLVKFKLYVDGPVEISNDGKQILSSGRIIGDGLWDHQENISKYTYAELNDTHPDFIWLPTNPLIDNSGYGNPFMNLRSVASLRKYVIEGTHSPTSMTGEKAKSTFKVTLSTSGFSNKSEDEIRKRIRSILRREGIRYTIKTDSFTVNRSTAQFIIELVNGESADILKNAFTDAGIKVQAIHKE